MNSKLKTLLVLSGAALLAAPALHAQRGGRGGGSFAARPTASFARPAAFSRPLSTGGRFTNTRPTRGGYYGRGGYYRGGYYGGGHYHHYGRYYYLGGVPYFYPFYGYGYPYGGFYGDGFYGDGFYGGNYGYADGAYTGRISSGRDNDDDDDHGTAQAPPKGAGPSLPSAVQRQLAKRGYYKGSVDGQFGPASRDALSRFQKSQGIKQTGRIDEDTLDALGFTDER